MVKSSHPMMPFALLMLGQFRFGESLITPGPRSRCRFEACHCLLQDFEMPSLNLINSVTMLLQASHERAQLSGTAGNTDYKSQDGLSWVRHKAGPLGGWGLGVEGVWEFK